VDTEKEELGYLQFFFTLPTQLARPEKTYYLCPSKKRKLPGFIIPLEHFKSGQPDLQGLVHEGLRLIHKEQMKKCVQTGVVLAKKT
jgi:hypothetical protein